MVCAICPVCEGYGVGAREVVKWVGCLESRGLWCFGWDQG